MSREPLEERLLDLTEQLVRIPSPSGSEGEVADLVEERLRAVPSLTVERVRHTVVARRPGPAPRLLVAAHLDTVPATDPPQPVERAGGRVSGRGAVDMKGGVAVMLALAEDLAEDLADDRAGDRAGDGAGTSPAGGPQGGAPATTFLFYDREEVGSHRSGMALLAAERPDLLEAGAGVLLEPTDGWVEAGCQGNLRVRATYRGRAAHTARPWTGVNAVHRAAGPAARVAAHDPGTVVVDGLPYRQSLEVVGVSGGGDRNVVPDRCEVVVNLRWAPGRDRDAVLAEVVDLLGRPDDVEVTLDSPAAAPALSHPALAALAGRPGLRVRPKLGWTDVGRLAQLGVPATNFGPGDPELAHGPAETVSGEGLAFVYRALAGALWGGHRVGQNESAAEPCRS